MLTLRNALLAFICLFASLACGGPKPSGPPPAAGSVGTTYPDDPRVSPHGKVRPSLSASTNIEEVEYYNPSTGTRSDYQLEVDRDADGNIERINFPNGGWKEIDGEASKNGDGTETYVDSHGVEYTIHGDYENPDDNPSTE